MYHLPKYPDYLILTLSQVGGADNVFLSLLLRSLIQFN